MGRCLRVEPGGIRSLNRLLDEFRVEIEYELIRLGLRLRNVGMPGLNLRDLWVIVSHPAKDGPLFQAMAGQAYTDWTVGDYLLAELVDVAHWLQWAKTEDGQKGRNFPARVPRPGEGKRHTKTHTPGGGLTYEQVMSLL